jgi:hypothetical protein
MNIDGNDEKIHIGRLDGGDWVIFVGDLAQEGSILWRNPCVLWRNPCSANKPLPPMRGWKPIHDLARGEPIIHEYVIDEEFDHTHG